MIFIINMRVFMLTKEQIKIFYKNWLQLNNEEMAELLSVSLEDLENFLSVNSDSLAFRKIIYAEVLNRTQDELMNLQVQYFLSKNHGHMTDTAKDLKICYHSLSRRVKLANLNRR
jgi:plasmid maintenance system antidote protein VapI